MKKLLFLLVFLMLFSFASAETEIKCTGSGNNYSGVFSQDTYCLIPVLDGKGTVKVVVKEVSFRPGEDFEFLISSYFSISSDLDPKGVFSGDKLDCDFALGQDTWHFGEKKKDQRSDEYPRSEICDTQRGLFYKDVDLVTLTVAEMPTSKDLKLEISLHGDKAFKEYLSLQYGKTVSEIDFRNLSQQFSIFESTKAGKITRIESGKLKTEAELHLSLFDKKNRAVFKLVNRETDKLLCEGIEVLFDSDGKTVECGSFGSVRISFDAEETEKYTPDESKGKEYFFEIQVKLNDAEIVSEDVKVAGCKEGEILSEESPCACGEEVVFWSSTKKYCCTKDSKKTIQQTPCDTKPVNGQPSTDLSELQSQINNSILEQYYESIFGLAKTKWPVNE